MTADPVKIASEALSKIASMTGSQPAAMNMPAEDWYKGLFYDCVGIAANALKSLQKQTHPKAGTSGSSGSSADRT